jgi:membrane-associated phospholipid phosphatase
MDIEQLEQYMALRCVPHYDYGLFVRFLVICQFTPLYLTIGMYAITFTYKYQELYYRFFSIGLTLNWLLSLALQYLIQSKPHIQNCGGGYSMPSWHAQHVFFFYTMIVTYLILQKKHMGALNLLLLNSVPALVCAARLMLGFNTFSELMVGNIIGVTFGFLYQYTLFKWVKPRVHRLLKIPILQWFGFRDHFFFTTDEEEYEKKKLDLPIGVTEQDLDFPRATCIYCQLGITHEIHH